MLGYEAYSLLFGMSSWTTDPDLFVKRFDPATHASDYTIDTEAHEPGGPYELPIPLAGAGGEPTPQPPPVVELPEEVSVGANNCASCHTDQSLVQALAVEEEEVKSEEASGEG